MSTRIQSTYSDLPHRKHDMNVGQSLHPELSDLPPLPPPPPPPPKRLNRNPSQKLRLLRKTTRKAAKRDPKLKTRILKRRSWLC